MNTIAKLSEVEEFRENLLFALKNMPELNFGMQELAQAMGMSRTELFIKMRTMNISSDKFIREAKLNRAMELINSLEFNVSEIAYMIGYKTQGGFWYAFKKQFGLTPSEQFKIICNQAAGKGKSS